MGGGYLTFEDKGSIEEGAADMAVLADLLTCPEEHQGHRLRRDDCEVVYKQGANVKTELDTPVLTVDADALDRNIAHERHDGDGRHFYRPHAKTHKSATVARKQIDAGAIGVCCAKLGEAEVLASEGIDNILITTPVIGESKIGRLLAARSQARIAVVADNEENINMLGSIAQLAGKVLDVLVDRYRPGPMRRPAGGGSARLADDCRTPVLQFRRIAGYQGKIQMTVDPAERAAQTETGLDKLATISEVENAGCRSIFAWRRHGHGTVRSRRGLLTEIQTGSYVFMTHATAVSGATPTAARTRVIRPPLSASPYRTVIIDAGLKSASMTTECPPSLASKAASSNSAATNTASCA